MDSSEKFVLWATFGFAGVSLAVCAPGVALVLAVAALVGGTLEWFTR